MISLQRACEDDKFGNPTHPGDITLEVELTLGP